MMAIDRNEGEYSVSYVPKEISTIANAVKTVPRRFINSDGNNVTDEALEYILPLIAGEVELKFNRGLPEIFVF